MSEILNKIKEKLDSTQTVKDGGFAIFYKGKQLKMRSGKSVWRTKQHASSALSNHLVTWRYNKELRAIYGNRSILSILEAEGLVEVVEFGKRGESVQADELADPSEFLNDNI